MTQRELKRIDDSKIEYYLTGESLLKAATVPTPPSSKQPTLVRVTHTNDYGPVDSDIFVRLGDPKSPLDATDFDTVSDWRQAALVEDLLWCDADGEWIASADATGDESMWSGTYEAELPFPPGKHLIELKIVSRVPQVCSIVLSDWKVSVK